MAMLVRRLVFKDWRRRMINWVVMQHFFRFIFGFVGVGSNL